MTPDTHRRVWILTAPDIVGDVPHGSVFKFVGLRFVRCRMLSQFQTRITIVCAVCPSCIRMVWGQDEAEQGKSGFIGFTSMPRGMCSSRCQTLLPRLSNFGMCETMQRQMEKSLLSDVRHGAWIFKRLQGDQLGRDSCGWTIETHQYFYVLLRLFDWFGFFCYLLFNYILCHCAFFGTILALVQSHIDMNHH